MNIAEVFGIAHKNVIQAIENLECSEGFSRLNFQPTFYTDKTTKSNMKPGDYIRAYRGKKGWTQEELGGRLGGIPKQHVSNMERGTRHISLKMAHKLAGVFGIGINQFLHN